MAVRRTKIARAPETGDPRLDRSLRDLSSTGEDHAARLERLEKRQDAPGRGEPEKIRLARDESAGVADGVIEALPAAGGSYVQADEEAFRDAVRNNIAELYALIERLTAIGRSKGDIQ